MITAFGRSITATWELSELTEGEMPTKALQSVLSRASHLGEALRVHEVDDGYVVETADYRAVLLTKAGALRILSIEEAEQVTETIATAHYMHDGVAVTADNGDRLAFVPCDVTDPIASARALTSLFEQMLAQDYLVEEDGEDCDDEDDPKGEYDDEDPTEEDERLDQELDIIEDIKACLALVVDEHQDAELVRIVSTIDEAISNGDYELAEDLALPVLEAYKRMSMGARRARIRSLRHGTSKSVRSGKVTRSKYRTMLRQRRVKRRQSAGIRSRERMYRRRTASYRRRLRPISSSMERDGANLQESSSVVQQKHKAMMAGKTVVVTEDQLAELEAMPNWKYLASLPNPKRHGTKDIYIAWYKNKRTDTPTKADESKSGDVGAKIEKRAADLMRRAKAGEFTGAKSQTKYGPNDYVAYIDRQAIAAASSKDELAAKLKKGGFKPEDFRQIGVYEGEDTNVSLDERKTKYEGYTIEPDSDKGYYWIRMPNGDRMSDPAGDRETAKKWIEQHIIEVRERKARYGKNESLDEAGKPVRVQVDAGANQRKAFDAARNGGSVSTTESDGTVIAAFSNPVEYAAFITLVKKNGWKYRRLGGGAPSAYSESLDESSVPKITDDVYTRKEKPPRYNTPINPLSSGDASVRGKMLRQRLPGWTKAQHLAAAKHHTAQAARLEKEWTVTANAAAQETWGRAWQVTDYRISGIGSDEFSAKHKDTLRFAAHTTGDHKAAATAHEAAARGRLLPEGEDDGLDEARKPPYGSPGYRNHEYLCGEVNPSNGCALPAGHTGPHKGDKKIKAAQDVQGLVRWIYNSAFQAAEYRREGDIRNATTYEREVDRAYTQLKGFGPKAVDYGEAAEHEAQAQTSGKQRPFSAVWAEITKDDESVEEALPRARMDSSDPDEVPMTYFAHYAREGDGWKLVGKNGDEMIAKRAADRLASEHDGRVVTVKLTGTPPTKTSSPKSLGKVVWGAKVGTSRSPKREESIDEDSNTPTLAAFRAKYIALLDTARAAGQTRWPAGATAETMSDKMIAAIKSGGNFDWYRDNPNVKAAGRALGLKTAKDFREWLKAVDEDTLDGSLDEAETIGGDDYGSIAGEIATYLINRPRCDAEQLRRHFRVSQSTAAAIMSAAVDYLTAGEAAKDGYEGFVLQIGAAVMAEDAFDESLDEVSANAAPGDPFVLIFKEAHPVVWVIAARRSGMDYYWTGSKFAEWRKFTNEGQPPKGAQAYTTRNQANTALSSARKEWGVKDESLDEGVLRIKSAVRIDTIKGATVGMTASGDVLVFRSADYDNQGNVSGPVKKIGTGDETFTALSTAHNRGFTMSAKEHAQLRQRAAKLFAALPTSEDIDEGIPRINLLRAGAGVGTSVSIKDGEGEITRVNGDDVWVQMNAPGGGPSTDKVVKVKRKDIVRVYEDEDDEDLDEAGSAEPRFTAGVDSDAFIAALRTGINAPEISVGMSTLGGKDRATVQIRLSLDPKSAWANAIYHNSRWAMFSLERDGRLENFAGERLAPTFRKTKYKDVQDAIKRINDWIAKVGDSKPIRLSNEGVDEADASSVFVSWSDEEPGYTRKAPLQHYAALWKKNATDADVAKARKHAETLHAGRVHVVDANTSLADVRAAQAKGKTLGESEGIDEEETPYDRLQRRTGEARTRDLKYYRDGEDKIHANFTASGKPYHATFTMAGVQDFSSRTEVRKGHAKGRLISPFSAVPDAVQAEMAKILPGFVKNLAAGRYPSMESADEALDESLSRKEMTSVAFAKKLVKQDNDTVHRILVRGVQLEQPDREKGAGADKVRVLTKDGADALRSHVANYIAKDEGGNLAGQAVRTLTPHDLLKLAQNLSTVLRLPSIHSAARDWMPESIDEARITVKITADDGDTWTTGFNGSLADAKKYYVGKKFNLGRDEDRMVKAVKVELVEAALFEAKLGRMLIELIGDEGEDAVKRIKTQGAQRWLQSNAALLKKPLDKDQGHVEPDDATKHEVKVGGKTYCVYVGDDYVTVYATRAGSNESLDEAKQDFVQWVDEQQGGKRTVAVLRIPSGVKHGSKNVGGKYVAVAFDVGHSYEGNSGTCDTFEEALAEANKLAEKYRYRVSSDAA